jgi:hypothetical protein
MPPITEENVYAALGLTAPAPDAGTEGAKAQEPAEPAAQTQVPEEGAKGQDVAEPAAGTRSEPAEEPGKGDDPNPEEPAGKQTMDEKQRRENAARRRQQEQQTAIETAVAEALRKEREKTDADWERFFAASGLKDTETGKPIKTRAEYEAWQQKHQLQQAQQQLKDGKLTPELMQQLISQNPVVQKAQAMIDQNAAAQKQAQQQAERTRISEEIAEIGKLDPKIQSVEDLLSMENFHTFKGYVDKGYSYLDSYKLSNMEKIATARAQQAQQQALDNARGKDHLKASGRSQGTGAMSVPPEVMRQYRLFNPGATDAQIQAHYNKSMKK